MNIEQLKDYCDRKGYDSRKYRFAAIADIMGISPEEAKEVEKITRYFRELFPVDQKGIELERTWHKPEWMWDFEKRAKVINENQGILI